MKQKINAVIAKVSPQPLCAGDIGPKQGLAAIGIDKDKQLDLVMNLEATIIDLNGLAIEVSDEVWPSWSTVGDVYSFYGVA